MAKTMADLFARYDSLKNAEDARQQAWQQQIYREHPGAGCGWKIKKKRCW